MSTWFGFRGWYMVVVHLEVAVHETKTTSKNYWLLAVTFSWSAVLGFDGKL